MGISLSRKLKLNYRKGGMSAFFLMMGLADMTLGGFSKHWTLLSVGTFVVIMGLSVGWLQSQKINAKKSAYSRPSRKYLPARSNLTPLPSLRRKRDYY